MKQQYYNLLRLIALLPKRIKYFIISVLDVHLEGDLRCYYLEKIRGKYIKSYRVELYDLNKGKSISMIRYQIRVRYNYVWYPATETGHAVCEHAGLKPMSIDLFLDRHEANMYLLNMVRSKPERELWGTTEILEKERLLTHQAKSSHLMKEIYEAN